MKLDIFLAVDNATWPAFAVDTSAVIRHANQAALDTFGTAIEGEPALADSIWSPEMDLTPQQFPGQIRNLATVPVSTLLRQRPQYGNMFVAFKPGARDQYYALDFRVQRQFANGFQRFGRSWFGDKRERSASESMLPVLVEREHLHGNVPGRRVLF